MSYQERIYSQNGKCNRNFVGPVPTTSSDICVFNRPSFIMSGASGIDCDTSITLNDTNVHILTGQTEFDLTFEFTGNTDSFNSANALFKYEIYKYIPEAGYFNNVPEFISEYVEWSSISGTSAFTTTITADTINPDGQYIVKGQYLHDVCTEFATLLNYKFATASVSSGGQTFGQYQPSRDFYFLAINQPDTPELTNSPEESPSIGALVVSSLLLDGTTTIFNLPFTSGEYIISLNGITLAPQLDYGVSMVETSDGLVGTLVLSGATVSGDVLTYAYTNDETANTIKLDVFDIETAIVSGVTDAQGSNDVYFNTTTGKYEIFLSMRPVSDNSIGIALNGVTLANNIDYYQSITNPRRIIFEGTLLVNDIINAFYNTDVNAQGNQFGTSININWTIENPPSEVNGIFTVEISNDENFTTIVSSATTPYIISTIGYSATVNLVGSFGDVQYYRVKNEKNFVTLCNDTLTSTAYSDTANITIQTNINNSY